MSISAVLHEIKALPKKEKSKLYDTLLAIKEVRENLMDMLMIELRRHEKKDSINKVFKKLGIKA